MGLEEIIFYSVSIGIAGIIGAFFNRDKTAAEAEEIRATIETDRIVAMSESEKRRAESEKVYADAVNNLVISVGMLSKQVSQKDMLRLEAETRHAKEISLLEAKLNDVVSELKALKEERQGMLDEIASLQEQVADLTRCKEKMTKQIKGLRENIDLLQTQNSAQAAQIKKLEREKSALEEKLNGGESTSDSHIEDTQ